ncbi:MAG: indolepyruvate oxidoreductase subunit beta [Actinobacteria bacterium]|nr:indolepyruvate oxidoreductase subunit beta [Actinomycetota bacterium]MDI6830473.1 indolepyruvate oxidoreductase subunit beta [Actinomycetota bacterium]
MPDVVLAGVGGQGNVLSARVLAETALRMGYDVKTSEVHGMAQRGGSVVCMVRWGEKVHSPLIPEGRADFLLAFELLEGLRYLRYLSGEGTAIVNLYQLDPLTVLRGDAEYPENALQKIRDYAARAVELDARDMAARAGNLRAVGSVLLGALSVYLDFPDDAWREAIVAAVPAKAVEVNLRAFSAGAGRGRGSA